VDVRTLLVAIATIVTVALLNAAGATPTPRRANGPPRGLTERGRLLWNFEALLRETFGAAGVSVSHGPNRALDFSCRGDCAPLSKYFSYRFTFARPRGSAFHVSSRRYRGESWGNYPRAILLRGRLIACDERESRYLFSWVFSSTASFTLGCDSLGP
jgi:hypothetical protein